jgi:hypothetical protein
MKILPVGAEFFHADGPIYMTKPTAAFRDFAKAPNSNSISNIRIRLYQNLEKYEEMKIEKNEGNEGERKKMDKKRTRGILT